MIEGLRRQQEKLKEILISVVSYDGDPERCKQVRYRKKKKKDETYKYMLFYLCIIQTLAPLMTAVNKALETSKRRLQKKR